MDNLTKGCPTQKKTRQFNLDRTNRGRITDLNNSKCIKGRPTFKIPIYETNYKKIQIFKKKKGLRKKRFKV